MPPTLDMEVDDPVYIANVKRLITIFFEEVPMIPIYQPSLDVAMQKHVEGYKYYFHRILDARWLKKA